MWDFLLVAGALVAAYFAGRNYAEFVEGKLKSVWDWINSAFKF
jgi:pyocin large subunit-like protein